MPERLYLIGNSTATSTAAPVKQPTGTAIRTMLQLQIPAAPAGMWVCEWGISFDAVNATPVEVELFGCTGAATMSTALVAADLIKYNHTSSASQLTIGSTGASAFATAAVTEGTVANYRGFDLQLVSQQWSHQFPLGREPYCDVSTFIRVRVTAAVTSNAYIYVIVGE